jgi:HEAT repeat protein
VFSRLLFAERLPVTQERCPVNAVIDRHMSKCGCDALFAERTNSLMKKTENLIAAFSNKDGWKRREARLALVDIGKPAVPYLIKALKHRKPEVRWEAAKTLGAINDPSSGPALVSALEDKRFEIRWLAAEGLIALKLDAIEPLLKGMIKNPESWELRQGVHHVLHDLERSNLLNKSCINLLNQLRGLDQELSIPMAAGAALKSLLKPDK